MSDLLKYLNELSLRYRKTPITEYEIANFNKRLAEAQLHFLMIKEKIKTDPQKNAERFLGLTKELDDRVRSLVTNIFEACDWIAAQSPKEKLQLPLSAFIEEKQIDVEDSKLSRIKVVKKGLNGHS